MNIKPPNNLFQKINPQRRPSPSTPCTSLLKTGFGIWLLSKVLNEKKHKNRFHFGVQVLDVSCTHTISTNCFLIYFFLLSDNIRCYYMHYYHLNISLSLLTPKGKFNRKSNTEDHPSVPGPPVCQQPYQTTQYRTHNH